MRLIADLRQSGKGEGVFGGLFEEVCFGGVDYDGEKVEIMEIGLECVQVVEVVPETVEHVDWG